MKRFALMTWLSTVLLTAPAFADGPSRYSVDATASRTGEVVSVAIKFDETESMKLADAVQTTPPPPHGDTVVKISTQHTTPCVKMKDGGNSEIIIATGDNSGPAGGDVRNGLKIYIFSVKGQDRALVVSDVLREGVTVWVDAKTIPVEVKASAGGN